MTVKLLDPQPPLRADGLSYDERAPGLYPGEAALVVSSGAFAAVSVEQGWLETGEASFWGNIRWIARDGSTRLTDAGQHVERDVRHSASAAFVAAVGAERITREIVLLLIGEAADDAPWSDEVRRHCSIVEAIKLVRACGPADPAALLGLATNGES